MMLVDILSLSVIETIKSSGIIVLHGSVAITKNLPTRFPRLPMMNLMAREVYLMRY